MAEPIIINNWQECIGLSPHMGFGDMRNVDVKSEPGVLQSGLKTVQSSPARVSSQNFTANAGTDQITFASSIPSLRAVTVSSSGTLPAGLAASTTYYTIGSGTTVKLATSLANAEAETAIDITDAGTGTHSIVTVNMGSVYWVVKSPNDGYYWALDSNGRLWTSRNAEPTNWYFVEGNNTKGHGEGLAWWENYLVVFSDTGISAFGPTTSAFASQAWTNSGNPFITGLTDTTWHTPLVGQDDIVYYCNDRYVGSLQENGTFVGTAATVTSSVQALDLPSNYITRCLAELGSDLLIGTSNGVNEYTMKQADIFPWDRSSSSFGLPIKLSEFGIKSMLNKGNQIYILAGIDGNLYRTNGSAVEYLGRPPLHLTKLREGATLKVNLTINPQSLADHDGRIMMAIGGSNGAANSSASGAWSYDPNDGSFLLEHVISTGSYGGDSGDGTKGVLITCIMSGSDQALVMGWYDYNDSDVTGIDYTHGYNRYDGSQAYADSPLYIVAEKKNPRTFTDVEIDFAEALESGDSVVIQYRTSENGTYTTLTTFNETGLISGQEDAGALADVTMLQIRAVLNNSQGGNKTPKVREIRLK